MKIWWLLLSILTGSAVHAGNIVSVDGSLTEIIYQLGAEAHLAGVDTTSRYPAAARELPQVGYMRQLSAEGILSLKPATVLASDEAGPAEVFSQLQQAGVRVVRIPSADSIDGVADKIRQVAVALDMADKGERLAARVVAAASAQLERVVSRQSPRVLFLMGAGGRGLMAAGRGTKAQAMMDMLGVSNVISYQGYKPVNAEAVVQAAPELILVANTGPAQEETVARLLAMTPAAQNQAVYGFDAALLLGFGPRLPQALDEVLSLIYPSVSTVQE